MAERTAKAVASGSGGTKSGKRTLMRPWVIFDFGDSGAHAEVIYMDKHRTTEQRRHARRKAGVCAWLQFSGDDATRGMVSVDLGLEGAQFSSLRPVGTGERVLVRLQLGPSHPTVECKGVVRWAAPMPNRLNHFGVRFVDLRDDERAAIESFLKRPSAKPALAAV